MSNPTNEQLEFARRMTIKQRHALRGLAMFPFFMSASERGDPEIYELIRMKLAQAQSSMMGGLGPFLWSATAAGEAIARKLDAKEL